MNKEERKIHRLIQATVFCLILSPIYTLVIWTADLIGVYTVILIFTIALVCWLISLVNFEVHKL
ncbi:MAG: hypothetical protein ABF750_09215 [Oenococcus oeni]